MLQVRSGFWKWNLLWTLSNTLGFRMAEQWHLMCWPSLTGGSFWNVLCSPSLLCVYTCCSLHGQWYPTCLSILPGMAFSLGNLPDTLPVCSMDYPLAAALSLYSKYVVFICFPCYTGNFSRAGRALCSLFTQGWLEFRMLIKSNYWII